MHTRCRRVIDARRRMLIDTQAGYQSLPPLCIPTCTGVPDSPLAMHARICMHELIRRDGKTFVHGDNIKFYSGEYSPRIDFHMKTVAQLAKVNEVRQQVDLGSVKSCRLPAELGFQIIKARFNSQQRWCASPDGRRKIGRGLPYDFQIMHLYDQFLRTMDLLLPGIRTQAVARTSTHLNSVTCMKSEIE